MFFLLNLSCALAISLRIKAAAATPGTPKKPCFYDARVIKLWLVEGVTQLDWGQSNNWLGRWGWITVTFHSFNEDDRVLNILYDQYDGSENRLELYEVDCDDLHIGKKLEAFMKKHLEIDEGNRYDLLGELYPTLWGKITVIAKHVSEKATAGLEAAAEASRAAAAIATEKAKTAATHIYRVSSESVIHLKGLTAAHLKQATEFIMPRMKALIGKLTRVLQGVVSSRLTAFATKIKSLVHSQLETFKQEDTWVNLIKGGNIKGETAK